MSLAGWGHSSEVLTLARTHVTPSMQEAATSLS
jgi:hypothetical protein